ncbi:MAG: PIG-L family deacetylase [Lentilitoribacter sp.]
MPLSDQARIEADKKLPHIVELWKALVPLQTVVSFMNTGAHPDDEMSEMLAAMAYRDGIDISYACSTRGEGGQNDLGTEAGQALGVLRTAEMEGACDALNLRMYWHSQTPDDTIFDFGFSKSGDETLEKWGKERTLKRFVDIIRTERPDIICPTFLDVPGQHGHHRAMTEAAHLVIELAADENYKECDLPPWQVKKLYLPAWSGAGQAYDDDLPPPPATLTIEASGVEPITGWSYARIGQQSRAFHKTQAMGRWVHIGGERDFPLHLAESYTSGSDDELSSGLAKTLRDIDIPDISDALSNAQNYLDRAIESFPNNIDIIEHACSAMSALRDAIDRCPQNYQNAFMHKLRRKEEQLSRLLFVASKIEVNARCEKDVLRHGQSTKLQIEHRIGLAESLKIEPVLPSGWSYVNGEIYISDEAENSDPYPDAYLPHIHSKPCLSISFDVRGINIRTSSGLDIPPNVVPAQSAKIGPSAIVINSNSQARSFKIMVEDLGQVDGELDLILPPKWVAERSDTGFDVTVPSNVDVGRYDVSLNIDFDPAVSVMEINYPHVKPRVLTNRASVSVQVIDVELSRTRVGYIGGGNDRVDHWLKQMGMDITSLSDEEIQSDKVLAKFDTIIIGIFALKFRDGLLEQMPRFHQWCENGGNLITLYHRPWDNWDPDYASPKYLKIGQPSLRWRVTDENSDVKILEPDHTIFNRPNVISSSDWENWHKERGLYFAMDWDKAYRPMLSMHDHNEDPLLGSLLVAEIGKGQHIHTSLILHHQMEKLTPGAFRLMANLVSKDE